MKKIIFAILITAGLTAIVASCSDDFLDVRSTESIEGIDEFNNDAGAKSFVTAVYAKFLDWNVSSFSWNGITSIASDDADKGSDPGDTGTDKQALDMLTHDATSISVLELFEGCYQTVNRANQALLYLPQLNNADPVLRARLTGEVKFLRALTYFNLVRVYGGVPIVDHVPGASQADLDMTLTAKTKQEVYDFIEQDLLAAIDALPEKSAYGAADIGRASKGAARGLLAKVYLYQQRWGDVITQCEAITGYGLTPDYATIWRESQENNIESLFEIQGFGGDPSRGVEGYSLTQGGRGTSGWGWGFNIPSLSLVNTYEPGDVRKDATIIFAGETLWDGRVVSSLIANPRYNEKAYASYTMETYNGNDNQTSKNIRVLRYAEVLLMLAEARNEIGGDAITPLNQVRNRAGLLNTTASGQAALRTAIWHERRVELAFEHDRYFDLVRTGQAQAAFTADGKTFTIGKNELFPFPQRFINEAGGKTAQNPGY
ncbi:MAG TPA: RagB/SusD family nutrient uptake outer membrane protein [Flavobacterium sp.]|nr:RagB/SusD family nutrient uptake outer membrane protein [Flavobacterium sp.]